MCAPGAWQALPWGVSSYRNQQRLAEMQRLLRHRMAWQHGMHALPKSWLAFLSQVLRPAVTGPMPDPVKPDNRELLSRALALLARRDLGRAEFVGKLIAAGFDKSDVDGAADWYLAQGFLNETRYVEGAARRLSAKYGASRVAHSLRDKGVTDEAIGEVLPALKDSELERARAIWSRKFHNPPADASEKSKHVRFLQSRGFSYDTIKRVIRGSED